MTKIDELEKLALAATPGPWKWDSNPCDYDPKEEAPWIINQNGDPILRGEIKCDLQADADYITAVNPAAVLELIEQHKQMKQALNDLIRDHNYPMDADTTRFFWDNATKVLARTGGPK